MKTENSWKKNVEGQLEGLQNAVNYQKTEGLKVQQYYQCDKRKNPTFVLSLDGISISPVLDYTNMNYFLLGMMRMKHIQLQQNYNKQKQIYYEQK